jgi:hypothetical protein
MSVTAYDVFISFKNLREDGQPTRDRDLAAEVYRYLSSRDLRVFFSIVSLEQLGVSGSKKAIDDALDASRVLVAVGTSRDNLEWRWVRYEWDSFYNDILSGVKPDGRVFAYIEGVDVLSLPRALRQSQTFSHGPDSLDTLYKFVSSALGQVPAQPHGTPPAAASTSTSPSSLTATSRVYLSYARRDEQYPRDLSSALAVGGINSSLDLSVAPCSDFLAHLAAVLRESAAVVVILSSEAAGSHFVHAEIGQATALGKRIVPVMIDDRSKYEFISLLTSVQAVDACGKTITDVARLVATSITHQAA